METGIRAVRTHTARMGSSWLNESLIANPMSIYPEFRERRASWFGQMTAAVVEIETVDGRRGLGFIGGAKGRAAAVLIEDHFGPLLIGQDASAIAERHEQLYRASFAYGRRGLAIETLSGIDLALWDLAGQREGRPVFELLGGATKDVLPAYVTGNLTERHLAEGFRSVKIALPHGPADGEEGLRANEALIRATRERIGPEGDLMIDCYMALTVPYAIELARRLRDYRLHWMEEPLLPDDLDGYCRLKDALGDTVKITAGEHEYMRYGFAPWIERKCLDVLQPDIYRAGGMTELRIIAAMAAEAGLPVIPHGCGAPTYHFVLATPNAPRTEFVDIFAQGGELLLEGEPVPAGGVVEVPRDRPGFGYWLNRRAALGEVAVVPIW